MPLSVPLFKTAAGWDLTATNGYRHSRGDDIGGLSHSILNKSQPCLSSCMLSDLFLRFGLLGLTSTMLSGVAGMACNHGEKACTTHDSGNYYDLSRLSARYFVIRA